MLDELQVFVSERPAWVNAEGWPLSWQHYQYGLRHIAREATRRQLETAQAMRMAGVVKDDWLAWQRDMTRTTEVPRRG